MCSLQKAWGLMRRRQRQVVHTDLLIYGHGQKYSFRNTQDFCVSFLWFISFQNLGRTESRGADMIMAALCCARRPVVLQLDEKPFYCVVAQHQQMCLHSLYYLSLTSCQHVRVETIEGLPQRRVGQGMQLLKGLDGLITSEQKGNRWTLPLRVECHTGSKFSFLFFGCLLYKKWIVRKEHGKWY